ncbi:hypothetical protein C2S51_037681 [Perilla frutescens var. frutescens]|nr:hypothetical protein C2S51_037681 [Perilla frutescens var. frutescens]
MDTCHPDWNTDAGGEFPVPLQRKPMGLENELVELLWQNGEIVLHSQNNRKQGCDPSKSKHVRDPNSLIQDDETVSWIDCPIDESFERDFCANFLSEIPSFDESNKPSVKLDGERGFKFGASEVNHAMPSSQHQDFAPPAPPPPRFQAVDAAHQNQLPVKKQAFSRVEHECSGMTIGSSHCASNQVVNEVDMSWASSSGMGSGTMSAGAGEAYARRINEGVERETLGPAITSCSGGSGSSLWKTSSQSNDTNRYKRKSRDVEESECPSDATESESAAGNKASQKSGTNRRSRVAEVHNQSERRRRDRINEKMKALQELIPHANKADKASMLDEAIEYMKSLQLQIQLMWMGRGMAPMMLPGMQHYMSRVGMGIGPPMLPAIQNLMRLSRLPLVDQAMNMSPTPNQAQAQAQAGHTPMLNPVNYQNQMQNSSFQEQYANYMNFHSMQNTSPQRTCSTSASIQRSRIRCRLHRGMEIDRLDETGLMRTTRIYVCLTRSTRPKEVVEMAASRKSTTTDAHGSLHLLSIQDHMEKICRF